MIEAKFNERQWTAEHLQLWIGERFTKIAPHTYKKWRTPIENIVHTRVRITFVEPRLLSKFYSFVCSISSL